MAVKPLEAVLLPKYQVRIVTSNTGSDDAAIKYNPALVIRVEKPLPSHQWMTAIRYKAKRQIPLVFLITFDTLAVSGRDYSEPQNRIWYLYLLTNPDVITRLIDSVITEEISS